MHFNALFVNDSLLLYDISSASPHGVIVTCEARAVHSVTCSQLPVHQARLRRSELWGKEVLVLGSGCGVRRLSHLDGRPLGRGTAYERVLELLEATKESRWCASELLGLARHV